MKFSLGYDGPAPSRVLGQPRPSCVRLMGGRRQAARRGEMANRWMSTLDVKATALLVALTWGAANGYAQSTTNSTQSTTASSQDTQFLQDLAQDSNFEIGTSKLALEKSQSADVKQYATMVIHDHKELKREIRSADRATHQAPVALTSMTSDDQSVYDNLKGLSGTEFDQAYIKQLIKGNDSIQREEKSESTDSAVPTVKSLATQSAAIDTKHADKAKALAQSHHVTQ